MGLLELHSTHWKLSGGNSRLSPMKQDRASGYPTWLIKEGWWARHSGYLLCSLQKASQFLDHCGRQQPHFNWASMLVLWIYQCADLTRLTPALLLLKYPTCHLPPAKTNCLFPACSAQSAQSPNTGSESNNRSQFLAPVRSHWSILPPKYRSSRIGRVVLIYIYIYIFIYI